MEIQSTQAVVLEVLQRASSQNALILKPAEAKLLEWETQAGFYTVLFVSIISAPLKATPVLYTVILFAEYFVKSFHRCERAMDKCFIH